MSTNDTVPSIHRIFLKMKTLTIYRDIDVHDERLLDKFSNIGREKFKFNIVCFIILL